MHRYDETSFSSHYAFRRFALKLEDNSVFSNYDAKRVGCKSHPTEIHLNLR
jgi:hypothetical protein